MFQKQEVLLPEEERWALLARTCRAGPLLTWSIFNFFLFLLYSFSNVPLILSILSHLFEFGTATKGT